MPRRVCFVVDGFNLYFSLKQADARPRGAGTRWLDLQSLCASYLHVLGGGATMEAVFYFSAIAKHLEASKPGLVLRHETYVEALRGSGVHVQLARFKEKDFTCPHCRRRFTRHEEKETDVAIGAKVLELALTGACEAIVLISGDTDLIPSIRTARFLRPGVELWIGFPFGRASNQLTKAAHHTFKMSQTQYIRHQFPDPVVLPNGVRLSKPTAW